MNFTLHKKIAASFLACVLVISLLPAVAFAKTQTPDLGVAGVDYVEGDIIVTYEDDATAKQVENAENLCEDEGKTQTQVLADANNDTGDVVLMSIDDTDDVETLVQDLNDMPGVAHAQPNFKYKLMGNVEVSDPYAGEDYSSSKTSDMNQYYLNAWGSDKGYGANVREAWNKVTSDHYTTVAVLDTGCEYTHEDLAANIDTKNMRDVSLGTARTLAQDNDSIGHGTHCAGIVAGVANNEKGIAGSSYNAKVLPIKVFNGENTDSSLLLVAYNYLDQLVESGTLEDLHVISMSLGGYGQASMTDLSLEQSIAEMRDNHDVITVCAGGNGDDYGNALTEPSYPGDFPECFAVTALDNDGCNTQWSDYNQYKDISAPGLNMWSTVPSSYSGNKVGGSNSSYASMSGTSMATPLVAGIASLLWTYDPDLTVDQAIEAMQKTAHEVNKTRYDRSGQTGSAGAIDAAASIEYVREHFYDPQDMRIKLNDVDMQLSSDEFTYDGSEKKPEVTLTYQGNVLQENVDYTLQYSSNIEVGKASVLAKGMGEHYKGTKRLYFSICYDLSDCATVSAMAKQVYTGAGLTPVPSWVRDSKRNIRLTKGVDYELSYVNNVDPTNEATVVVSGIGDYRGSVKKTFTIDGKDGVAIQALFAQLQAAQNTLNATVSSSNGWNVLPKTKWVKSNVYNSLKSKISAAQTMLFSNNQAQIDTAKQSLQAAVASFNASKQSGLKGALKSGSLVTVGSGSSKAQYKVTSFTSKTITYNKCLNSSKKITIPATISYKGLKFKVVGIGSKAFKGKKVTSLSISSKTLSKSKVKNSLKSSKIKTIKVKSSKYKTYKSWFSKKSICGKAGVKVKK